MAAKANTPNSVKCFVKLKHGGGTLRYGYRTRHALFTSLKSDLGITESGANTGILYGINNPDPYRATKINTTGGYSTESSWASDAEAIKLLSDDNYNVTPPKSGSRGISSAKNFKTVYVEIPGEGGTTIKYAWNMAKDLFDAASVPLGISAVTANDIPNLVWGVNDPKPPRASKRINGRIRETFMSAKLSTIGKAQEAGWNTNLGAWESIDDTTP